ncbi:MAG: DNA polymerase IV, partial [Bacilli bacterium]
MSVQWVYGLCDMQSFFASCEVASRAPYADRAEYDDATDPPLVVAGDPERRSGIVLAATPPAKRLGVSTAMRLGEALRLVPGLVVVRPQMEFYLQVSVRIQHVMRSMFPLQEQFSVDEGFFAIPTPSDLFPDPAASARELQHKIWDQFRIRCRIGLAPNKWMAKMANAAAKKSPGGIVWWTEDDIATKLHPLPVTDMWGLKRRAEILRDEFKAETIGDVGAIPLGQLRDRFGVWGEIIHGWSHGRDRSGINPDAYRAPNKSFSHRTTLPRDFDSRKDIAVVILELLDEVCSRMRKAHQKGRRVSLGLTYAGFDGGFCKAQTLTHSTDSPDQLYPHLLALLDRWWPGQGVRAVMVGLDALQDYGGLQLTLFRDEPKKEGLLRTIDEIRAEFGTASIMRAVSLTDAGQLRDRSRKIGGHYA